jgi:foldase protein PrsA
MRTAIFSFVALLFGCAPNTPHEHRASLDASRSIEQISAFPKLTCASDAQDRRDVRARHIAITAFPKDTPAGPKATPDELRAAYAKLSKARLELLNGTAFETVWLNYADRRSSSPSGDLGYFKKGVMVPEFEKIAFCLPVGEISPVVRTVFGFHLIQVTDVRH